MNFLPIIKFEFDSYCFIYTHTLLALVNDMSDPPKKSCIPTYLPTYRTVPRHRYIHVNLQHLPPTPRKLHILGKVR